MQQDMTKPRIITEHFINGQFVKSQKGQTFQVINPANQQVIAKVQKASIQDMEKAINAARMAFDQGPWKHMTNVQRSSRIYKLADLIEKNADQIATLDSMNNGKPVNFAKNVDLDISIRTLRSFAGWVDKIKGKSINVDGDGYLAYTRKQPVGVCAMILPWNFPIALMIWKLAPCLATGCVAVIKTAEQTPLSSLRIAQLIKQAGFSPGVVNMLSGFGEVGAYLVRHQKINKISFTGSTQVGYDIMRNSHQKNLKRVTLQLGGKGAIIITKNANLKKAVPQSVMGALFNSGQICTAGSRTFVHQSLYDSYLQKIIGMIKSLKVGNPLQKDTILGPLASKQQLDRVLGYIQKGKQGGAKIALGGKKIQGKGYYLEPTIFTETTDDMAICKEQIFGPVMIINKFSTNQQALKRANNIRYGLVNGVFTQSFQEMMYFSENLLSGSVYCNCFSVLTPQTPFGGFKDSGIGRQMGQQGLQCYLQTKTVFIKKS